MKSEPRKTTGGLVDNTEEANEFQQNAKIQSLENAVNNLSAYVEALEKRNDELLATIDELREELKTKS